MQQKWGIIEKHLIELIEFSPVHRMDIAIKKVAIIDPLPRLDYDNPTPKQMQLQMILNKEYPEWFQSFNILLRDAPFGILNPIRTTDGYIQHVINFKRNPYIKPTIDENKKTFIEMEKTFNNYLNYLNISKCEVILLPDTNALIRNHDFSTYRGIVDTDKFTIIIISTVLSELDKLKINHKNPDVREKAEKVIKFLKGLRNQGNMKDGVTVDHTITVKMMAQEPSGERLRPELDLANMDDRIIQTALEIQMYNPSSCIILVTSDINLQNKAEMFDLPYAETPEKQEIKITPSKKINEEEKRFLASIKMEIQQNQEAVSLFPNWVRTLSFSEYNWRESKELTDKLSFVYYDSLRSNFLHKIFNESDEGEILKLYSLLLRFKQRVEDSINTYTAGHYNYDSEESRNLLTKLRFSTNELFEQFTKVNELLKKY